MVTPTQPPRYVVSLADPRAPSEDEWATMTPEERARVVAELPSEVASAAPPEGDAHRLAKEGAMDMLRGYFRRIRRRIYLSSELPVYYPGERMFAPDLIAVLDVEDGERRSWVVSQEGRGIDLALEVVVGGSYRKDAERNVELYGRLGIREYFIFDQKHRRVLGYELPEGPAEGRKVYRAIVPQAGRWTSRVLGLDVGLGPDDRIRFHQGTAEVQGTAALLDQANRILEDVLDRTAALAHELEEERARADAATERAQQEATRAQQEATRALQEATRAQQEATRAEQEATRAERLAAKLRTLGVDPDG